jgi:hypothetical protein
MKRYLTLGALLVLGLVTPAAAQTPPDLEPGARIRVVDQRGHETVGTLLLATSDSLIVNTNQGAQRRAFDVSSVTGLQVSQGQYRRVAETTLITTGALALVGGLIGAASYQPCDAKGWGCMLAPDSRGEAFGLGLAGGAVIGLPLGLIVGLAVKHDRWADVPLPGSRAQEPVVQLTRRPGGLVGVGLSIPLGGRARPER